MDALHALREAVEASGLTHRQIARRLGKYDAYISQALTRSSNPSADTLATIARACGYRLELVPVDGSGDSIVVGLDPAGAPGSSDSRADEIAQARALLARASALLESVASDDD